MQRPRIFGWGHIGRGRTNIAPYAAVSVHNLGKHAEHLLPPANVADTIAPAWGRRHGPGVSLCVIISRWSTPMSERLSLSSILGKYIKGIIIPLITLENASRGR
jgi:hypothetical protein